MAKIGIVVSWKTYFNHSGNFDNGDSVITVQRLTDEAIVAICVRIDMDERHYTVLNPAGETIKEFLEADKINHDTCMADICHNLLVTAINDITAQLPTGAEWDTPR